jgi:hypothetical protein
MIARAATDTTNAFSKGRSRSPAALAVEGHIDAAILELQRARESCRTSPDFAIERLGEARLCIAAARIGITAPPRPLTRGLLRSPATPATPAAPVAAVPVPGA